MHLQELAAGKGTAAVAAVAASVASVAASVALLVRPPLSSLLLPYGASLSPVLLVGRDMSSTLSSLSPLSLLSLSRAFLSSLLGAALLSLLSSLRSGSLSY
jgi:hypothetical protein